MVKTEFVTARWLTVLVLIDVAIALILQHARCPWCKGPLHAGHFHRKPRGCASSAAPRAAQRLSWCCGREGCRKRLTPPSVRYWGRLYFVGPAVLAMAGACPKTSAGEALRKTVDCSRRTWLRWRQRFALVWESATGRMICGWLNLQVQQRQCVAAVLALWPGSYPYQAAQWQLLIHPLTGGKHWEKRYCPHGQLNPQRMAFAAHLAELQAVPSSV